MIETFLEKQERIIKIMKNKKAKVYAESNRLLVKIYLSDGDYFIYLSKDKNFNNKILSIAKPKTLPKEIFNKLILKNIWNLQGVFS